MEWDGMACDGSCVCMLIVQTCVSDLKCASTENTAARNECADVSRQLSVSKSMVVDLQESLRVLHVKVCDCDLMMVLV